MQKHLFLVLTICLAFSAGHAQTAGDPIKLSYFTSTPKAIDGCQEAYTYDSVALKKEKYIFMGNLQDVGFIHVNGKNITLKRLGETKLVGKIRTDVWQGSGYTVTLVTTEVKQVGDEGALSKGTIEIKYGQTVIKFKIHGEGGC